jgi:hypothetical protein
MLGMSATTQRFSPGQLEKVKLALMCHRKPVADRLAVTDLSATEIDDLAY